MNHLHQQRRPMILVIDDDLQVLGEVAALVSASGYACHCSNSAEAAVRFARDAVPALIICGIHLNGHSGLELCERIRQDAALADVPVMFLSGAQIPDIIRRSHAAGGSYYLRKPFDPDVLVELVDKALGTPHLVGSHLGCKPTVNAGRYQEGLA